MILYSAPAKVILSGEHAVVYGKPACATAVDLRMFVALWNKRDDEMPRLEKIIQKHASSSAPLENITSAIPSHAVEEVISLVHGYLTKKHIPVIQEEPFAFQIFSQIPLGRGLGSSAALAVAVVACLLEWYSGKEFDQNIINSLAYKVEKQFHHNPSGIDNSVSCYGGLIFYRKEFEFLKHLSSLPYKISKDIEKHLFLIDTGKPDETTAEMVKYVRKRYNSMPQKMETLFQLVEKETKRLVLAIVQEDKEFFKKTLQKNQEYLAKIGIVSRSAKRLISSLASYGVGKITGAGGREKGSGFFLFYAENPDEIASVLSSQNIYVIKYVQDARGVLRHDK